MKRYYQKNISTKIIIDSSQGVVNRLDYDHLGYLRNKTTEPQVEMLWRGKFLVNEIEMYVFGISLSDPRIGYGPLKMQKTIFEVINKLVLQREPDKPVYSWWIPAGIIIAEIVLLIDALACESALRQNDKLWDEWNYTHSTIDGFNNNPYNPFYGTGYSYDDYSGWLTDWNRRSRDNHEQIKAVCWEINM